MVAWANAPFKKKKVLQLGSAKMHHFIRYNNNTFATQCPELDTRAEKNNYHSHTTLTLHSWSHSVKFKPLAQVKKKRSLLFIPFLSFSLKCNKCCKIETSASRAHPWKNSWGVPLFLSGPHDTRQVNAWKIRLTLALFFSARYYVRAKIVASLFCTRTKNVFLHFFLSILFPFFKYFKEHYSSSQTL